MLKAAKGGTVMEYREGVEYLYFDGCEPNQFRVCKAGDFEAMRKAIDTAEQLSAKRKSQGDYGVCPHCGGECRLRERRKGGNDTCENGHVYPSAHSVKPGEKTGLR